MHLELHGRTAEVASGSFWIVLLAERQQATANLIGAARYRNVRRSRAV